MIEVVLTDIEGTTSSLSFVKDVLFPYARQHMAAFVQAHADEAAVRCLLDDVAAAVGRPLSDGDAVEQLLRWIDEDRKITPLKALQGLIWEDGYRRGDFTGHVYEDAVRRLREWHGRGVRLYVFSSGSVHAQKLLFGHTAYGDLTPLFSGYFDTNVGAKQDAESYRCIAKSIAVPPQSVLFLSDIRGELDAAQAAGMATAWLVRDGDVDPAAAHSQVRDFDGIACEFG
ncbi:acireductone synthase [Methylogaea oryzae]|uniref:Enolase-phosphatase E1 n=1 Tax=Methylogaea oryzae TaxID=1295382 RepID=A0A8D5AI62_9GAMM|nr:acireductone synthase [Methylogaea oryzae]BBL72193.1 enolase-phosphatase E1 [Methylogaea oryzae]